MPNIGGWFDEEELEQARQELGERRERARQMAQANPEPMNARVQRELPEEDQGWDEGGGIADQELNFGGDINYGEFKARWKKPKTEYEKQKEKLDI